MSRATALTIAMHFVRPSSRHVRIARRGFKAYDELPVANGAIIYDQAKLQLDLLEPQRDMGDSLQFALYDDEFGESLRASENPDIVAQYLSLVGEMAGDVAVARCSGRSPNMKWDHPFERRLVADDLISYQELWPSVLLGLRREVALVTNDDDARPGPRRADVSAVL